MLFLFNAHGAEREITPEYGNAPIIDGIIDRSSGEWDEAIKENINLYQNLSNPQGGLPIDLWIMQNDTSLYISIQFELESSELNVNQFLGLLISPNASEISEDFEDARIIHFSNISLDQYQYLDYYINNSIFYNDTQVNGKGAAKLDDNNVVYEFSLNLDSHEDHDVYLDYRVLHSFKIIFAKNKSYPEEFTHENIITIFPDYPPVERDNDFLEILYLVLTITVFSAVGAFIGIYIYKITQLKEKIKRIRS